MSEEFNWLDYSEPEDSAPAPSPAPRSSPFYTAKAAIYSPVSSAALAGIAKAA